MKISEFWKGLLVGTLGALIGQGIQSSWMNLHRSKGEIPFNERICATSKTKSPVAHARLVTHGVALEFHPELASSPHDGES